MKQSLNIINKIWIIVIVLFLLFSTCKGLLAPISINSYENRPANVFPAFRFSTFVERSFQDGTENALADQVTLSTNMKQQYNLVSSKIEGRFLRSVLRAKPLRYIDMGNGLAIFGGTHLTYYQTELDQVRDALDSRCINLNTCSVNHPDLTFYVYYIERERDINLETCKKSGTWEYLKDHLTIPDTQMRCFTLDSFDTYSRYFFRTDHHWNCYGSYKGYLDLCDLFEIPREDRIPCGKAVLVQKDFAGSKSAALGADTFTEEFYAFPFSYPSMNISVNGEPVEDYGRQREYLAGTDEPVYYGLYYGADNAETVFDTGCSERDNLLIIGESYDNAILKLLASHFHITCAVDLRAYAEDIGHPFVLSDYVREHEIDKVLLIGSMQFFTKEEFELTDNAEA